MPSRNVVYLMGHLGKDAVTKALPSGSSVTNFSLATERRWKAKSGEWEKQTDWHNVVAWSLPEERTAQLVKGALVDVEGHLQTRSYEGKDGRKVYVTEVVAGKVNCLWLGQREGPPSRGNQQPRDEGGISDDDVPF